MTKQEMQQHALARAREEGSYLNYPTIIAGFLEKGIPEDEILPRENVLTFQAWKALGRSVKKGEHGVRVLTFVSIRREDDDPKLSARPWCVATTVFHISQTELSDG